jgi:hypothetical protein
MSLWLIFRTASRYIPKEQHAHPERRDSRAFPKWS